MDVLINLDVDDLEKAVQFYSAAFDLKPGRRLGPSVTEMIGGTAPIYLLAKPAGSSAAGTTRQRRSYERHWTPVHLDFVVEEIESAVKKAIAAGARLESSITTHAWGKLALLADPFGHGFCLIQFLGRGYDEVNVPVIADIH